MSREGREGKGEVDGYGVGECCGLNCSVHVPDYCVSDGGPGEV